MTDTFRNSHATGDRSDTDADDDGIGDATEGRADRNGDGKPDYLVKNAGPVTPPTLEDTGILEGGGCACTVSGGESRYDIRALVGLAALALALARRRSRATRP